MASSLLEETAAEIDRIYALRMRIEECYRDTKSHRFGWSFEDARATTADRYAVLLLIATLAMFVVLLIGQASERKGLHVLFQANTIRSKRILSLFFLGRQMIHRPELQQVKSGDLRAGFQDIQVMAVGKLVKNH